MSGTFSLDWWIVMSWIDSADIPANTIIMYQFIAKTTHVWVLSQRGLV